MTAIRNSLADYDYVAQIEAVSLPDGVIMQIDDPDGILGYHGDSNTPNGVFDAEGKTAYVNLIKPNLTIYNAKNGSQVPEADEESLGAYLLVNWDDDNSNDIPDLEETGVPIVIPQEDDLAKITLSWGEVTEGTLELIINCPGNIKVWEAGTKFMEYEPRSWNLASQTPPSELWLEGTGPSAAERDVQIELKLSLPGEAVISDTVKATVVMLNLGNAVYREMDNNWDPLIDSDRGHCALVTAYTGNCNRDDFFDADNFQITEMQKGPDMPVRNDLSSITNNGSLTPFGCYTTGCITYSDRLKILKSAKAVYARGDNIHYEWNDVLLPNNWNDTINGIAEMRCDGLVEVCYEINNLNVWGKIVGSSTHWDIRNDAYQAEHNDFDYPDILDPLPDRYDIWGDTLMPSTQSGYFTPFDAETTFSKQNLCYPIGHKGGN